MTKSFKCDEKTQNYIDIIKSKNPYLKTESDVIRLSITFFFECIKVKNLLEKME